MQDSRAIREKIIHELKVITSGISEVTDIDASALLADLARDLEPAAVEMAHLAHMPDVEVEGDAGSGADAAGSGGGSGAGQASEVRRAEAVEG